jgi:hypothetical protein
MTIKKCSCGHKISSKGAKVAVTRFAGKRVMWVNCPKCESTATLIKPLKIAAVVAAIIIASCAPKEPSRFTVCEPVAIVCKTGQCPQAMADANTGALVSPNQCDEVRQ